jgi:hypothetical protein
MTSPTATARTEPGPGVYRNIAEADYRAWPLMSPSMLWHGNESMLQLDAAIRGLLDTDSDDKKFGRDFHCRLLEPQRFRDEYVAMPAFEKSPDNVTADLKRSESKATAYYKAAVAAFESEHRDRTIIPRDDMDTIEAMAKRVYSHKAVKLFHASGGCEVSIVGELCGVKCKGKVDKLIEGGKFDATIIDVKKCRTADPHKLKSDCLKYGYHLKAAWYVDLATAALRRQARFCWVYIEDTPGHDVVPWFLDEVTHQCGRAAYTNLLHRYKLCVASGEWPGRAPDIIHETAVPDWYVKQMEQGGML